MKKEIKFTEVVIELINKWKLISIVTVIVSIISIVVSLILPEQYKSTAVVAYQSEDMASALAGGGGIGALLGGPSKGSEILGYIESEEFKRNLIDEFDLKTHYDLTLYKFLFKQIRDNYTYNLSEETGFLEINFVDSDSAFAAKFLNGSISILDKIIQGANTYQANKQKVFYENRLKEETSKLADIELKLIEFQEKKSLYNPEKQGELSIEVLAELTTKLAEKQIEYNALKQGLSETNPRLKMIKSQVNSLRKEREKLISGDEVLASLKDSPKDFADYFKIVKEIEYHSKILEILTKQYEAYKLQEAKSFGGIKLIQKAYIPQSRFAPKRAQIVVVSTILGCFFGMLFVFAKWYYLTIVSKEKFVIDVTNHMRNMRIK